MKVLFQLILGSYLLLLMHDFIPHTHPHEQAQKVLEKHHHHHHHSDHSHPDGDTEDNEESENFNFFQLVVHQQSDDGYHSHPLYYLTSTHKVFKAGNHPSFADHPDGKPPPDIPKQKFSRFHPLSNASERITGTSPLRAPPALS